VSYTTKSKNSQKKSVSRNFQFFVYFSRRGHVNDKGQHTWIAANSIGPLLYLAHSQLQSAAVTITQRLCSSMLVTNFNDGSSPMLPCSCCRCLLYGRGASSTAVATCYCSHLHHHHCSRLIIALFLLFFSWPLLLPCLHQCSHHCSCCCHFGACRAITFPLPLLLSVSVVLAIIIHWLLPI